MIELTERPQVGALPLAPKNPLPLRQRLKALRAFHTGLEALRDAGGPVSQFSPRVTRLIPPVVIVTSPQGGRDILGRTDAFVDKNDLHAEMRHVLGDNLFDLPHEAWLRAGERCNPSSPSSMSAPSPVKCPRPPRRSAGVGSTVPRSISTPNVAG